MVRKSHYQKYIESIIKKKRYDNKSKFCATLLCLGLAIVMLATLTESKAVFILGLGTILISAVLRFWVAVTYD